MVFDVRIEIDDATGALVLALATVERRGYTIRAVQACRDEPAAPMRVRIGVESSRPIEPLLRHLRNLCDCIEAEIVTPIDGSTAPACSGRDAEHDA